MCGEKQELARTVKRVTGITPAYAGKSVSHCAYCICDWDHPRVCGEKNSMLA